MSGSLNRNRYEFIDIAKGIGIILVIFGHVLPAVLDKVEIVIYAFHMPMFFLLAGLFASSKQISFGKYFAKQTKRLLLPFIVCFGIGCVATFLIPIWENPTLKEIIHQLIYASPSDLQVGAIWFLAAMFDVAILFYFYQRIILSKNDFIMTIFSLFLLAFIAFYLPFIESKIGIRLPFKIDYSLMALVFYVIGYLLRNHILIGPTKRNTFIEIGMIVASLCVLMIGSLWINGITYLSAGLYGHDVFTYIITALSGTYIIIKISRLISKNRLLEYIGRNSLVIFSVHSIIEGVYDYYVTNKITNAYIGVVSSIAGTILILSLMLLVSLLFNRAKDKIA